MVSKTLLTALRNTWQAIASDLLAAFEGEHIDNEIAVECCLDADRLLTYGGPEGPDAQDEFDALIKTTDYPTALKAVCAAMPSPFV